MSDADSAIERDIITKISNARYVDLTNLFCDATRCHAMIDGKLAFRDRHHIAAPYAASLAEPLERAIFMGTGASQTVAAARQSALRATIHGDSLAD